MNYLQRQLRDLSDRRLDDTAVEISACERARRAFEVAAEVTADGIVDARERRLLLRVQRDVVSDCDQSLDNNVREQPELDGFIASLGELPAKSVVRVRAHLPEAA